MWEAVRHLQELNLKISIPLEIGRCFQNSHYNMFLVCDGAKPNRKFLKELGVGVKEHMKNGIVYKTVNQYCRERFIYFMSNVPHLIKTTRNCWYSSTPGGIRCMWVCVSVFCINYSK